MTQEQQALLDEAKRRYPKGTLYVPTHRKGDSADTASGTFKFAGDYISDAVNGTSIYRGNDKFWAKIISPPLPQITNNYELY